MANKALLGKLAERGILPAGEAVRYADHRALRSESTGASPRVPRLRLGRSYDAAKTSNLTASWTTQSLTTDEVVARVLTPLRARSRDQAANNDYARRFVGMVRSHVVGPDGFAFQARTVGSDGRPDDLANQALENAWREWGRARHCDMAQRLSFAELCRLWIATVAVDGEVIVRRRLGPEFGRYQYALQLIDPELLDVNYHDALAGGRFIRHGIEFDDLGRPQAYYFRGDPAVARSYYSGNAQRVRVPAGEIYHHFVVERIGQKRGIPWLATPALRLMMLNGYEEAALVNARAGASKMGMYLLDEEAPLTPEQIAAGLAARNDEGEFIEQMEAGLMTVAPPGVKDIINFDPGYPNGEFEAFSNQILRGIASGFGVAAHKLANNAANVNYSSAKVFELEERELWTTLQNWMIESFLRPLYEDWLAWQLKLGTIEVPTRKGPRPLSPSRFEKYTRVHFQGRRWKFNEPVKEEQARRLRLDSYMTSPLRELQEMGLDPEDVARDWKRWKEILAGAGFELPEPGEKPNEPKEPKDDGNEDPKD